MVEFALVMPLLMALVLGIIDYGLWFNDSISVRQGVREAARKAAVQTAFPGCGAFTGMAAVACGAKSMSVTSGGTASARVFPAVAATGASMMQRMAVGPVGPRILWAGFGLGTIIATPALLMPETVTKLLQPLRVFHQEWVDARIEKLTYTLTRFKETPSALAACFAGAVVVQAILVARRHPVSDTQQRPYLLSRRIRGCPCRHRLGGLSTIAITLQEMR